MPSPLEKVDQNLQTIRTIEGGWSLPKLPSEAALDISSQPAMTPTAVSFLLQGLADDFEAAEHRRPVVNRSDALMPDIPDVSRTDLGRTFAGVVGIDQPEVLSNDAVRRFKTEATERGYLDLSPQQIDSPIWLPEYSTVAREMSIDDRTREFAGEGPGSMSLENLGGLVEEWLSPQGLYRAAVNLDLWWDFDAIGRESGSWGDKWREYAEEPWNPRALVDALTGPIDDLVFPIINWALMLTGIGEVWATARGLHAVGKGVQGARAVAGTYRGSQGLRYAGRFGTSLERALVATDRSADIARLQAPSFLSTKIAPAADDAFAAATRGRVSDTMNAWRSRSSVTLAKKANQQVYRMGFASNLQSAIDDEEGGSIGSVSNIDEYIDAQLDNPLVDWGVDLLFTPSNIFEPGLIVDGARALGRGVQQITPGFEAVTDNQALTAAFHRPMVAYLEELGDPVRAQSFKTAVKKSGLKQALADELTGGDLEQLGGAMAFVTTMSVVDGHARTLAQMGEGAMSKMDTGMQRSFFMHRNKTLAQLTKYDPDDLDTAIERMAAFGSADALVDNSLKKGLQVTRRNQLREAFLEDEATFVARQGAVPDGHVRLYGNRDDIGDIQWTKDPLDGDPYIVDLTPAEADRVIKGDNPGITARYRIDGEKGNKKLPRLSDAAKVRVFDPEKAGRLKGIIEHHNSLRKGFMTELLNTTSPQLVEQYVYETLPSFANWTNFTSASHDLRLAAVTGALDNVRFTPPTSAEGRRLGLFPEQDPKWSEETFKMFVESGENRELSELMSKGAFSPFARDVQAGFGRVTVAKADTVTKQEAISFAHEAKKTADALETFRKFSARAEWRTIVDAVDNPDASPTVVADVLANTDWTEKTTREIEGLIKLARQNNVKLEEVDRLISSRLQEVHASPYWSERFNIGEDIAIREADIVKKVKAQVKELRRQAEFLASEIEGLPEELASGLATRGWKAVYGVNFAAPEDMLDVVPEFADVALKHMRSQKLQSFFGRQDPNYIRKLKQRRVTSSLHAALNRAKSEGKDVRFNLGAVDEKSGDMTRIMDDLYDILEEEQEHARRALDELGDARFVRKIAQRAALSTTPMSLERLGSELGMKQLTRKLIQKGFTPEEATATFHGLMRSQSLGFEHLGLYQIEAALRSRPNLTNSLRLLGRHQASDQLTKRAGGAALTIGGTVGGATLAGQQYLKDNPEGQGSGGHLAATALGAVGGKMASTAVASRMGVIGESTGRLSRAADAWDESAWGGWAYLSDHLANIRDLFRFSLSPIFDASRYSEAVILNQIGELPAGLKDLKLNQSPTSFRRMLAKEHRTAGESPEAARRIADVEWEEVTSKFAAAAKGDFEWETIDSIGRRFSSVGILGFSPADWMASSFGHMVRGGAKPDDAYKAVRDIYTYGTTGRSAAEMSTNFVFFPFSFTKKTFNHLRNFYQDDLTRLMITHDAMKTYQLLDENYDLSQQWKDRLPALSRMYRLNILAYGVSPGRFGGVNAPMLEAIRETPVLGSVAAAAVPDTDVILNMFAPQAVQVRNAEDADALWEAVQDTLPLMNDVTQLMNDLSDQGRVVFSETHLSADAEVRRGYEEWRAFQGEVTPVLRSFGLSWSQATRDPIVGELIRQKRVELQEKYPAWEFSLADGASNSAALNLERTRRLEAPKNEADLMLAEFDIAVDLLNELGVSTSQPEDIPPQVYPVMRAEAIRMASKNPEFLRLYNRFYRQTWGDIAMELRT